MQIALELGVVGKLFPILEGNFEGGFGWRKVGEADWFGRYQYRAQLRR